MPIKLKNEYFFEDNFFADKSNFLRNLFYIAHIDITYTLKINFYNDSV